MTNNPDADALRELLVGRRVVSAELAGVNDATPLENGNEGTLTLDDGTILRVEGNEGCGGCTAGWFSITTLNRVENVITNVETAYTDIEDDENMTFRVFVFAQDERLLLLQADGWDNGWYGVGYWLTVVKP
jgi:hypothetical protein